MRTAVVILLLFYTFSQFCSPINAAQGRRQPNPLRKPGGCYEDNTGHLKSGEIKMLSGQCVAAECRPDGSTTYNSCGAVGPGNPKCPKTSLDLSKTFPECCPRIVCQ